MESRIWQTADRPRNMDMRCRGIDGSHRWKRLSILLSNSSMMCPFAIKTGDRSPGLPVLFVLSTSPSLLIQSPTSNRTVQNSISVGPSCSAGRSPINGERSLSLTLRGRLVLPKSLKEEDRVAPESWAERLSRMRTCHHSRRRISASKGGRRVKLDSRCSPMVWARRLARPVSSQRDCSLI